MFDQSSTTVGPEMSNRGETIQTAKAIRTNVVIASVAQSGMSRNPRRGRSVRGEVSGGAVTASVVEGNGGSA